MKVNKRKPSYVIKGRMSLEDEVSGKYKGAPKEKYISFKQDSVHNYGAERPVYINNTPTEELQKTANQRGKMNQRGVRYDSDGTRTTQKKQRDAYFAIRELQNRKNGQRDIVILGKGDKPTYTGTVEIGSSQDPYADRKEMTHPRTKKQTPKKVKGTLGRKTSKGKSY